MVRATLRTCKNGHQFQKSSDCPTCPVCEEERKPKDGFLSFLSAPARRALENQKLSTLIEVSKFSEKEIGQLHGMGPSALAKLKAALKADGLTFRK